MTVYTAYRGGLWIVDPAVPRVDRRLAGRTVECVASSPDAPGRVFAGTSGDGLYRSVDGGGSFGRVDLAHDPSLDSPDGAVADAGADAEAATDPGESRSITALAVSPHDPDEVWVGTEPSRVHRSTDGGDSFERLDGLTDVPSASEWSFPPRPHTHHVRWIEPCPADPVRWYVGIEAGALLVTPDAGETWIDRPAGSPRDTHTLATHPDAPDRVYAAAGDGYAESDDRGRTWAAPDAGLDHGYVWGLAVDPADPGTVLVSAASDATAAHRRGEAYLYRKRAAVATTGAHETWERLQGRGLPTGDGTYRAVLASGSVDDGMFALNDRGLYRTADAGDSFERVSVDLPAEPPRAMAVG
ncbi:WD40/YVTN/BNR-like repeat-containing protein [Halorubrum sp. DTA98]|uniref:WD40/YVTN/BNR-like repeat-containing protein n=1 Tax=Halorubrum sp. DTA98 TaxID=3402163 RepID=UPI003AAE08AE